MASLDKTSCCSVVSIGLTCTVFELSDVDHSRSLEMTPDRIVGPYSILIMDLSYTISEIYNVE